MAHPGTLPVPNKTAIEHVIRVGIALGSDIANFTEFDRKNYFYPDIPKGYQISQYKYPIVSGGMLGDVAITRIHLEEDTGLSKHDRGDFTLVDYNRAGVPLMELVTEPVIHSAEQAGAFARELQLLLRALGVSEANMEKGEMRVESNISISDDPNTFGTKVEVKNLNSFKAVEKAIAYELARMEALYEAGRQNEIVQETRGWDETKQTTFSQRSKENAQDYRYFPDPDIPKFMLSDLFAIEELRATQPEYPWNTRARMQTLIGNPEFVELFVADTTKRTLLESIPTKYVGTLASFIASTLTTLGASNPSAIGKAIDMIGDGLVTSTGGKTLVATLVAEGGDPDVVAKEKGLLQISDPEVLRGMVTEVIGENATLVAQYKAGKEPVIQALVGVVMKKSKGSANPAVALQLLKDLIK